MPVKYGEMIRPWVYEVRMKNDKSGDEGKWEPWSNQNLITYKYVFKNKPQGIVVNEREPDRRFII